jgi:hypothetical protein
MQRLLVVAHVGAIGVYLGASVLLALLIEVVGRGAPDASVRRERWAELFNVYDPVAIAALGVVVMTGAWSITPYKEALGKGYFEQIGQALVGKLGLAFLVVMCGTWVCFGMCHRIVRAHQGAVPVTNAELDRMLMRLRSGLWLSCALTLATVWVALGIKVPLLAD